MSPAPSDHPGVPGELGRPPDASQMLRMGAGSGFSRIHRNQRAQNATDPGEAQQNVCEDPELWNWGHQKLGTLEASDFMIDGPLEASDFMIDGPLEASDLWIDTVF